MADDEYDSFDLDVDWGTVPPRSLSITEGRMRTIDAAFNAVTERQEREDREQRALIEDRVRILGESAKEQSGCDTIAYRHNDQCVVFSWPGDSRTVELPLAQFDKLFGLSSVPLLRVVR